MLCCTGVTVVAVVVVVAVVATVVWLLQRHHAHGFFKRLGIPYVKPHIIYGSLPAMRGSHGRLSKFIAEYGKVFGYFSGARPNLVVSDLDMIKQILIKDFHNFSNRPKMVVDAEPVISTLVGLRNQRWKEVRSLLAPTFSMSKMKLMADIMNEKVRVLLEIVDSHVKKDKPVEWYSTWQGLTLDTICECALALKSQCQRDQKDPLLMAVRGFMLHAVNWAVKAAIYFPVVGKLMSFLSQKASFSGRMTNMIVGHLKKVIKIRRTETSTKTIDVLQLMLEASELTIEERGGKQMVSSTPTKKVLSEEEIIANAWVFLLGGFETTANALTTTTYLLAKNPEQQEKLYREIKEIIKDRNAPVSYEEVSQLTYLDQVMSESLRLFPPVVTFIIREAAQDTEVCGVRIPKNTGIMIPIWDIHMNPEYWPDPTKFDPERFSSQAKSSETRHAMSYIPFGAGPRNCIGMRFAQLESKLALSRLIINYRLECCEGTPDPLTFTVPTVTLCPVEGVYIRAVPRTDPEPRAD